MTLDDTIKVNTIVRSMRMRVYGILWRKPLADKHESDCLNFNLILPRITNFSFNGNSYGMFLSKNIKKHEYDNRYSELVTIQVLKNTFKWILVLSIF